MIKSQIAHADGNFQHHDEKITNHRNLVSTNLNQKETNLVVFSGQSSLTQTFIDNISVPILHLVYQVISSLKSFEKLRNVKLGMAALIIYYGGLLAFLLHVCFL